MKITPRKVGGALGRGFIRYITPIPTLRRQAGEIAESVKRVSDAFAAFKNAGNRPQPAPPEPPEGGGEVKEVKLTPEELFEKLYRERGFTETGLAIQSGKIRVAKFIYLLVGFGLPVLALYQMAASATFIAPLLLLGGLVFLSKAVQHAWFDAQIYTRSFLSWKDFMSRPDLFRFIFT